MPKPHPVPRLQRSHLLSTVLQSPGLLASHGAAGGGQGPSESDEAPQPAAIPAQVLAKGLLLITRQQHSGALTVTLNCQATTVP